jgi:HTH-type transcriptional regulator/antitoxin HigA
VIALTVRHDRIDGFWFTLMHEFSHVRHGDALSVDSNLIGEAHTPSMVKDDCERRADSDAVAALVEPGELHSFTLRAGPMYSTTRIIQFAHRIKIHPGIIVGQLQHRGEVSYHSHRDLLVKVRDRITSTAMTDGWGHTIEIEGGEQ